MSVATRGKIYFVLGIIMLFISICLNEDIGGAMVGFGAGFAIAWSYWYWWRNIILKKWGKGKADENT